jgi:hypothetical protein
MPNMDDIAFFDSELYERRGGIWSDAGRKSSTAFTSHEESPQALFSLDTTTTSSESTQKGDDASIQSAPAAMSAASVEVSSSPTNLDESLDSLRNSTRRRTWFSSATNEEIDTSLTLNLVSGSNFVKPEDHAPESDLSSSDLNQSKPSPATNDVTERTSEREIPLTTTRSTSSRRSVSQHSIEVPQNLMDQEIYKPIPIPQKSSEASIPVPSPPSFFNTLKARAADKQAIKETAKETMRKWGVNWAGFRKDINPGQNDDNSEATNQSQAEGDSNTTTQKSRTSYAEVRAAVAERKGREKASQLLDHGSEPSSLSPEIPRSRTQSTSLSPDASSTTPEPCGTVTLARAPSPSTRKSSPSMNMEKEVQDQDGNSEESVKPTPIHVQPVAKTMSIPGIHASHRGEVQSMGYVALQPQLTASSGPVSETVLKSPAIQTVYRFLKPNGDRRQEFPEVLDHNPSHRFSNSSRTSLLDSTEVLNDQASEVLVFPTVTPSQAMVKPKPPPLPPRSVLAAQQESPLPPFGSSLDMVERDKGTQMNDPNSTVGFTLQEPISDDTPSRSAPTVPMTSIGLEPSQTDLEQTSKAFVAEIRTPPPLPPRRTPVLHVSNS